MTIHQTQNLLKLAAAGFIVAGAVCLCVGIVLPLDEWGTMGPSSSAVAAPSTQAARLPSLQSFGSLFAKSLQARTRSAASTQASGSKDPSAPQPTIKAAQLTLVGTIGNSLALVRGPDGTIAIVEPGDDINGAPVMAVRPSELDMKFNGRITTLRTPGSQDVSSYVTPVR